MLVENIYYDVNWRNFRRHGDSVFFPAHDVSKAKQEVAKQLRELGIKKVFLRGVIEDGVGGVRAWKL